MTSLPPTQIAVPSRNDLGEGPVWDAPRERLLWVDHITGCISQTQADGQGGWQAATAPGWAMQPPLAAVVPRAAGGLALIKHTDVVLMDADGGLTPFARLGGTEVPVRWCDAKCDAQGRIWATGFAIDLSPIDGLYSVDAAGTIRSWPLRMRLGNGFDWSPDGRTLYVVDSLGPTIHALDFDPEHGTVARPRVLITFPPGEGGPNGLAVDREGQLWVAMTGGGRVLGFSAAGTLLYTIPTLALPTSCAFGGPDRTDLFVTTRRGRLPDFILHAGIAAKEHMEDLSEEAGALCICRPGVTGITPHLFRG